MSVEQQSIKRISRFYTQLHRLKTLKWKSVQWIGGFFNAWKVWRKAKEVLPLTSLMGTNGLQGCWSRNQVSIVTSFSSLIYSPSTNWLNKGQLPKVHFPQGFFSWQVSTSSTSCSHTKSHEQFYTNAQNCNALAPEFPWEAHRPPDVLDLNSSRNKTLQIYKQAGYFY